MIRRSFVALFLTVVQGGAIYVSGQVSAESSSSYKVVVDGKPIGTELVKVTNQETGVSIHSTSEMIISGLLRKIETSTEMKDRVPNSYSVDVTEGSERKKYSIVLTGRRARVKIEANNRATERLVPVHDGVIFLDSNVWHHYAQLLAKYDVAAGGDQRFYVLTPQATLRELLVEMKLDGRTSYGSGSSRVKANRFMVLAAGSEVRIIASESNKLLSIEIPALETKVTVE